MILNWAKVVEVKRRWQGDIKSLSDAISVIDQALSRHEIEKLLTPPSYNITPGHPPVDHVLSSQGQIMLGFSIVENNISAEVTIHAP